MRKLDKDQLKLWALTYKNQTSAIAFLETKTGIGFYALRLVFQGKREPKISEQTAICEATGLDKDTLFPVVENKKESVA